MIEIGITDVKLKGKSASLCVSEDIYFKCHNTVAIN